MNDDNAAGFNPTSYHGRKTRLENNGGNGQYSSQWPTGMSKCASRSELFHVVIFK